jgi:hypothetical protein
MQGNGFPGGVGPKNDSFTTHFIPGSVKFGMMNIKEDRINVKI